VRWPCYYGIDLPDRDELIAATHTLDQVRDAVGATSLAYLTLEGLQRALGRPAGRYCRACFTGEYPIPVPEGATKLRFEGEAAESERQGRRRTPAPV
jgi:amidophosphoribosyltransferase